MGSMKKQILQVKGLKIEILRKGEDDYISITNIAKFCLNTSRTK